MVSTQPRFMQRGLKGEVNRDGWLAVQVSPPSWENISYWRPRSVLAQPQRMLGAISRIPGPEGRNHSRGFPEGCICLLPFSSLPRHRRNRKTGTRSGHLHSLRLRHGAPPESGFCRKLSGEPGHCSPHSSHPQACRVPVAPGISAIGGSSEVHPHMGISLAYQIKKTDISVCHLQEGK